MPVVMTATEELKKQSDFYKSLKKVNYYTLKSDLEKYVEYRNKKKSLEEEWMQAIKNRDTSIMSSDFNKRVTKTEGFMNAYAIALAEYLAEILGY